MVFCTAVIPNHACRLRINRYSLTAPAAGPLFLRSLPNREAAAQELTAAQRALNIKTATLFHFRSKRPQFLWVQLATLYAWIENEIGARRLGMCKIELPIHGL